MFFIIIFYQIERGDTMISIDLTKFKKISITECINHTVNSETDSYTKRIVGDVISTGKKSHKFNELDDDKKIEYLLKYSLIQIVPSKKWNEYSGIAENAENDLYIMIKRHYFLSTGSFPE